MSRVIKTVLSASLVGLYLIALPSLARAQEEAPTAAFAGSTARYGEAPKAAVAVPTARAREEAPKAASAEPTETADSSQPVEVIDERFASGKIKIRREMTLDLEGNYINHGHWTLFSEGGEVIAEGDYQNHQRNGKWVRVHAKDDSQLFSKAPYSAFEGPFTSEAQFKLGKLDGSWTILDVHGRKVIDWQFVSDVRHGTSKWFYPTGELYQEMHYDNGLIDGQHRRFDADGDVVVDDTYQMGRKLALKSENDKEQNLVSEVMYLEPQLVIDEPVDWWNARPATFVKSGDGVRHGRSTTWHENGRKKSDGLYEFDARDGQFKWWYPNSQQMVIAHYKDGQRHGTWTWWHANGLKSAQGQFVNGSPTGTWTYWNEEGRLYQKTDFDQQNNVAEAPQELELELTTSEAIPADRLR